MKIDSTNSDETILSAIGSRLESVRLQNNLTQKDLAGAAGVSKATIERLESGESVQLTSLVRVLRALGLAERIDLLVPQPEPSPIAMLKLQGKQRRRATGKRTKSETKGEWTWGDGE